MVNGGLKMQYPKQIKQLIRRHLNRRECEISGHKKWQLRCGGDFF